jgi:hypothetical protein
MCAWRTRADRGNYGSHGFASPTFCPCVTEVVAVAARTFSEEQPDQRRSFPGIGRDDLIRTDAGDVAVVNPGRGRGRLTGWALLLSSARCRGWVRAGCRRWRWRLAEPLGLDPEVLEGYGRRRRAGEASWSWEPPAPGHGYPPAGEAGRR